jgi:tRNA threonylcarbamoyladenosine biosynthesis protein TsaB
MNLLAIDTGTEFLSIAACRSGVAEPWAQQSAGGARASSELLPAVLRLLALAEMPLTTLDALVFGAGPGSFTGLRTACSVVQGLALGAQRPVLPVDSLLAVAEDARYRSCPDTPALQVMALLDARMDEMYCAHYAYAAGQWELLHDSYLLRPEDLALPASDNAAPWLLAGNVFEVYAARLPQAVLQAATVVSALPTAPAMLRLAPALLQAGGAVDAALAMPRYVRDKVAKTTAERMAEKAAAA